MIVLNENEWAEEMIKNNSLGDKPFVTLNRVAKYYFGKGYPRKEVEKMLARFLLQCDPMASLPKWADTLEYALNRASKNSAIDIEYIGITDKD